MAWRPSIEMFAPMRMISLACMKRFSKIVSVITEVPCACVARAMYCACMSVGNPGYSSVMMSAARRFTGRRYVERLARAGDHDAAIAEFIDDGGQVLRRAIGERHVAAGNSRGDEKRSGFDAVGNDGVLGAVELIDALDANRGCSGALDFGAHFREQFGEVGDFRLARGVADRRFAFGEHCGSEDIFRAGHRDFVEVDCRAVKPARARLDVALIDGDRGAHFFEGANVKIDGTRADGAAAGKRNFRVTESRDERAESEDRGAHGFYEFVGSFGVRDGFGGDGEFGGREVRALHASAHVREQLRHCYDVAHARNVGEVHGLAGEQRCGHRGKRGVFRSADANRAT